MSINDVIKIQEDNSIPANEIHIKNSSGFTGKITNIGSPMKWYEKMDLELKARNAHIDRTKPIAEWIDELKPSSINGVMCDDVKEILNKYFHGMERSKDIPEAWLMGFLEIMATVDFVLELYKRGDEDEANRMRRLEMSFNSSILRTITMEWIDRQRYQ